MQVGNIINEIFNVLLMVVAVLKATLFIIGIFFTRKFKPAKKKHKYGICIAARNEEKVIGNLLDSINKQDYPKDLITVFVVADNCDDNTAKIAKKHGAIVYERHDNEHRTKGYALQYLFKQIEHDYKTNSFEGYFIFDADNLLKKNYISKMNDAFDSGEKIITSYRNSKNFDENWISSNYAIHWIRSVRIHHRARSFLRLATNIQGTGFLFSNEIVENGWKYTSLTEDRALTADAVAQGYQISYQNDAMFYDEQPTNLKIALRQRLRWSKGHLQAFVESGPYLFVNVFLGKHFVKTKWKDNNQKGFFESIRHRIASFDTLVQLTPVAVINLFKWILVSLIITSFYSYYNGVNANVLNYNVITNPGINAIFISILIQILLRIIYRFGLYFSSMVMAVYVLAIERKRIKKIKLINIIKFIFMWPWFDIIGRYTTYAALFMNVTWKPIPHESKITIDELNH